MSHKLQNSSVRKDLPPRREPYWAAPIAKGKYIGLRKIDAQRAPWIARLRDDAGRQAYHSLGYLSDAFDFDRAKAEAEAWFRKREVGISDEVVTVTDACREYVKDRRREKGEATAHDAKKRFERTVYKTTFGDIALAKLRTPHIKSWRDGLKLSKATANLTLTTLKAALNLAVTHRQVSAAASQEWRDVKPYKGAGKRRDLYLDLAQRRDLLKASHGTIRDLIEAAMLTGAGAGELVNATRRQFDERTSSMTFTGKTGTLTVPLSPTAVALFRGLAKATECPAAGPRRRQAVGAFRLGRAGAGCRQAITSGMTTLDVARLVGTSVVMIEKHYGHLVASAARERLAQVVMA
jgi:hypothetical protein